MELATQRPEKKSEKRTTKKDYKEITEGYETQELINLNYKPNDIVLTCKTKLGSTQKMVQEKRGVLSEDCLEGVFNLNCSASECDETFQHGFWIESEFYIAPLQVQIKKSYKKYSQKRGMQQRGNDVTKLSL